jgi:hypothetical protein
MLLYWYLTWIALGFGGGSLYLNAIGLQTTIFEGISFILIAFIFFGIYTIIQKIEELKGNNK